jgi:SNF2 family DNA or RNA helicase
MLVVKKHRKLLLNLKEPSRVTTVLPKAKMVTVQGVNLVSVPHMEDEVRVLRNLGFDAPAPITEYYDWPSSSGLTPFAHQKITAAFKTLNPRMFDLSGMGSGKTLSTLWAFDYLRKEDVVDWMLVLSPLSTLERAWGDEIFRNFMDMSFAVVHGTREKRHALLGTKFDVYLINHDGIKSEDTLAAIKAIPGRGLIVIDEIAEFSNASTDRWKFLNRIINPKVEREVNGKTVGIVEPMPWVWGLTGTPIPNAPTDAWAQTRLISPSRVPAYAGKFKEQVMVPLTRFKWVAREGALELVKHAMQPSIRFSREECIDLPPITYVTRMTTLTPEQTKAYNEMLRTFKTEYEGGQITAVNAAVKAAKLVQICCGVAYGTDGDVIIPAQSRMDLVKEIIRESEGKVLVFAPLTGALNVLANELRKDFTVEVVDGHTPKGQRDEIFKRFQNSKDPHVLVANAGTMSHGLSFTAASTIVWFAPGNSNRTRMQANERMARPGQTKNMLIVNIAATPAELKMYDRMDKKESLQDTLLEIVKEMR